MTDKADRLHSLISEMQNQLVEIDVNRAPGPQLPLWQVFQPLAQALGFQTYGDLRDQFLALCRSLEDEVQRVFLKKESVRASWLAAIKRIENVFDAENFGGVSAQVFANHFQVHDLTQLDTISERLQNDGVLESDDVELVAALEAIRNAVEEFEKSEKIDMRVLNLIKLYLRQIEKIYTQCATFGDDLFWQKYKEIFATFIQVHTSVADAENRTEIFKKIAIVGEKLAAKSIAGIKIPVGSPAIQADILPLLPAST